MLRWGSQRHTLLLVFLGRPNGLTPDRAGNLANVSNYNQRRRCSELERDGFLEPTGGLEAPFGTGDYQRVLRITPKGHAALRAVPAPPSKRREYHDARGNVLRGRREPNPKESE
jgi:hypothetical protein